MAEVIPFRSPFRLPGPRDRLAVIGRTGSGKTHFAAWVLSLANWDRRPWLIVDYKRDDFLKELPTRELDLKVKKLPREPGLYVTHPPPRSDDAVEALLWRVWERGNTGLYIDEGHILPDGDALQAILTQGRSKSIATIMLTQRPKWVSRFVFSEADAFSIFHLNDKRDKQTVQEVAPVDLSQPLGRHHSYYYRVDADQLYRMNPVPDRADILGIFDERNPRRTKARMI